MVNEQRAREGLAPAGGNAKGVIEFTQPEKSPVKSKSRSPVKETAKPEKHGKRTIINQPLKAKETKK